jgi:hypothetical protein
MLFTVLGSDHVLIDGLSFVQSPVSSSFLSCYLLCRS